jgi:hypothetical protein
MRPTPAHLRSRIRGKLAHIQVLCEELAQIHESQAPMTKEQAHTAANLLVSLGKKTTEALTTGHEIQRLNYLK